MNYSQDKLDSLKHNIIENNLSASEKSMYDLNESIKLFKSKIDSLDDNKIKTLLNEQLTSDKKYKDSIDQLIKDYINDNQDSDELSTIKDILKESKEVQKKQLDSDKHKKEYERTKENKQNPFNAFKQGIEDYKEKGLKESLGTITKGLKEGMTLKNLGKGLLHGAGVVMDNPALNIIASSIESKIEDEESVNLKQIELLDKLKTDNDSPKYEKDFKEKVTKNKEILSTVKAKPITENTTDTEAIEVINMLDSIEVLNDIYQDHGKLLEDINESLIEANILTRKQMFLDQDRQDDKTVTEVKAKPTNDDLTTPEEDESSLISDAMAFGSNGNKRGSKSKVLGFAKNALKFAGVIGLAYTAYEGVRGMFKGIDEATETFDLSEGQIATKIQSFSSGLGGLVESLSFGLLDAKDIATGFVNMTSDLSTSFRKIFEDVEVIDTMDKLEKKGSVDTSILGKSEIRDWKAIEDLSYKEVRAVYDYADWSIEDSNKIISIMEKKKPEVKAEPKIEDIKTNNNTVKAAKINNMLNINNSPLLNGNSEYSNDISDLDIDDEHFNDNVTNSDIPEKEVNAINIESIPEKEVNIKETNTNKIERMDIPEIKEKEQQLPPIQQIQNLPSTTSGEKEKTKKVSDFRLDDGNIMQLFTLTGLRL